MRTPWITFIAMLSAAALTLWGGERVARRTEVIRESADRERLLDFASLFRKEIERLELVYDRHVSDLTAQALASDSSSTSALSAALTSIAGIRQCEVYVRKDRILQVSGNLPATERLPDIAVEGGKKPFNPANAVILPAPQAQSPTESWLTAPDKRHLVYWRSTAGDRTAVIIVDIKELLARSRNHLEQWLSGPFEPLRSNREMVSILAPDREAMVATPVSSDRGPAALVIPFRTRYGDWQIQAWDRVRMEQSHDTPTLIIVSTVATMLTLLGAFLSIHQKRAIRLAEERVSFVNRVSHELGSPLTNILLNLDLASESLFTRPVESEHRLRLVGEEVRRLARLVSNVLTFSRSERKALNLNPTACVPDEVIAGMLDQFMPSLHRRGILVEWKRGADATAMLDPDALSQIVGNLISNIEKYAVTGGWLGMQSDLVDGRLKIRISDHGPGIPKSQWSRIFKAFERVNQKVNEGSSGTGLGLSIARDLARRMGGDLVLLPAEQGCVFECDIPVLPHLAVITPHPSAA